MSRLVSTAAVLVALAGATFAQQPNPAGSIATENARLSAQVADGAKALERVTAELEALRKAKGDLDESMQRIERRAQVHALGREFAQTLIERRRELPARERFAAGRDARARLLAATSDANVRVERELGELADRDPAALGTQRDLLARLAEIQQTLLKTLREADAAARDLEKHTQAARATLTRLLFWIPAPPSTQTASELVPALAWTASPANWRAAGAVLREAIARQPFWPAIALLAAVLLVAFRGRLQLALVALAPAAVTFERYRFRHVATALAITLALAAPGPIVLRTAATLLGSVPHAQPFPHALGDALAGTALLLLALSAFAWLLDRRGVAVGHFGWDEASLGFVARALRKFTAFFVPLIFIGALNGLDHAPFANRESLGRLAFSVAMIVLAAFLAHLFRTQEPADAAVRRARTAQLGGPVPCGLVRGAGRSPARGRGARRRRLPRGRLLLFRDDGANPLSRPGRGDALRPDGAVGAGPALAPRPAAGRGGRVRG